jgi:hypothetical protein
VVAGSGNISSVFGRTGVVVPVSGDYTAAQVTNAADTTSTYSNPAWISALAASKLTGIVSSASGGAGSVSGMLKADGSGNVSAGIAGVDYVIPSGNVATATALLNTRLINGVSFNGASNITITANLPALPTGCSSGQYATAIAVTGNLTCAAVSYGQVTGAPSLAAIATSGSASDLLAGTVPTARLGSGTASSTTCLYGDQTYKSCGSGGGTYTAGTGLQLVSTEFSIDSAVTQTRVENQAGTVSYCRSTTGSATYTCAMNPTLTSYTTGMAIRLNANFANVTTATLNVDTLGAKSILSRSGGALTAGDIQVDKPVTLIYDGTSFILQSGGGSSVAKNGLYLTIAGTDYIPDVLYTAVKPSQTGWSWVGTPGTESFGADGSQVLTGTTTGRVIRTRSTGAATSAIVVFRCGLGTNTTDYSDCGVFLRESATGKGAIYQQSIYGSIPSTFGAATYYQRWSSDAFAANLSSFPSIQSVSYVKIDWSTSNVVTSQLIGATWRVLNTTAKSTIFTTAQDQLAFVMTSNTPGNVMTILSVELL